MKLSVLITIFLSLFLFSAFAQNPFTVKGEVTDTALHIKMVNASILVLNAKDSILRKFTRTGADGAFSIGNLKKGKYILLIDYPGYADYVDRFTLDSTHTNIDFGNLSLILKSRLLADVIVKINFISPATMSQNLRLMSINLNQGTGFIGNVLTFFRVIKYDVLYNNSNIFAKLLFDKYFTVFLNVI